MPPPIGSGKTSMPKQLSLQLRSRGDRPAPFLGDTGARRLPIDFDTLARGKREVRHRLKLVLQPFDRGARVREPVLLRNMKTSRSGASSRGDYPAIRPRARTNGLVVNAVR